jgi:CheY-like chemotaxis protein
VRQKTILLVDDEQGFLEALADALRYEGHRVLTATTGEDALSIFQSEKIDLATIDIMMPPGESLENEVSSHETGIMLCREIKANFPDVQLFCLSVVSDRETVRKIQSYGVRFLHKGETPLDTVLKLIRSRLTGTAYSTDPRDYEK